MTWDLEWIGRLFLEELEVRQAERKLDKELKARGLKGLSAYYVYEDEWAFSPPSWTPKQFKQMWDLFTHDEKVRYVKSLIL
jgi:hypothetical protein